MNEFKLIMFPSITLATKARNALLRHSVPSDIVKTPKINGKSTCGYSLRIKADLDDGNMIITPTWGFYSIGQANPTSLLLICDQTVKMLPTWQTFPKRILLGKPKNAVTYSQNQTKTATST